MDFLVDNHRPRSLISLDNDENDIELHRPAPQLGGLNLLPGTTVDQTDGQQAPTLPTK